jgi:hypothetical protein
MPSHGHKATHLLHAKQSRIKRVERLSQSSLLVTFIGRSAIQGSLPRQREFERIGLLVNKAYEVRGGSLQTGSHLIKYHPLPLIEIEVEIEFEIEFDRC